MTGAGAIETFEIERKYQVGDAEVLPGATGFAALGLKVTAAQSHALSARYFDTPSGALAGHRVALRHRTGGKDEGWHLKTKGAAGARELLWPHADQMPMGLQHEVNALVGDAALAAIRVIAHLRTERRTVLLLDGTGEAVVELADDRVDATNELSGRRQQWREWEAELVPGADSAVLDLIEPLLTAHGAVRVRGTSKIQRTMQPEGETP